MMAIARQIFPTIKELRHAFGRIEVHHLPVPHDCTDGFLGAYWRRPYAYLDAGIRNGISTFGKLRHVDDRVARLRRDLEDGTWQRRNGHLLRQAEIDLGYRLIVACPARL